ncbi:NADP-specific glutamate dehydrogenase [Raoultella ornithinolytica]|nr:NADP-specific glutamate dehydrogenase [Raoultella ornithinolytica]
MDQMCTLESFLTRVQQRDPHQTEFAQAVREVMTTLWPFLEEKPALSPALFAGTSG